MKKDSSNSLPISTYGIPILFVLLTIYFLWYNYVFTTGTEYFPTEIMVNPPDMDFKLLQTRSCRFDSCFDIYRCEFNKESLIQVYIYPTTDFYHTNNDYKVYLHFNTSLAYRSLLYSIQQSPFYVSDPSRACVFIPAIDTLIDSDNDPIHTSLALKNLPFWNRGINHIIFSFLPSLSNSLPSVSTDRAAVASPGLLYSEYRTGFDVSIPVYNFPERLDPIKDPSLSNRDIFLLIIIPLEFDTSLEETLQQIKSQNPYRITILDFCQDERCVDDETVDYSNILLRSKYCLLLLGYRHGTPDLLDVMMQGCVPVYSHGDYMLPFEEVLDWRLIGVPLRPAFLPQILSILERIGDEDWNQKHRQSIKIWSRYFSSLGRIALTTLMILNERVFPTQATPFEDWNLLETDLRRVNPLLMHPVPAADTGFTVVIFSNNRDNSLKTLIGILNSVSSLKKVVIVSNKRGATPSGNWGLKYVPIELLIAEDHKLTNRFLPLDQIQTDCVMSLDDDVILTPEEIAFGYQAWREFPDRIVGYYATFHTWDQVNNNISELNEINIISTKAAFYHNHYQKIFSSHVPSGVIEWVDTFHTCEDVAMNLLISSLTNKPAIKLNSNKCDDCQEIRNSYVDKSCLKVLIEFFGPMELQSAKFHIEEV